MSFFDDFHVHSSYSRATARDLDLEHLQLAAQLKGVTVVATGDFTHPAWFEQIAAKLEPDDSGLLTLEASIAATVAKKVPPACRRAVKFMLVTEISNIYKKDGRTRKNHNLAFFPSLERAAEFKRRLGRLGNVASDGRPILGLDARDLLEITLETCPDAFLVPAHIWTPWFSLFGSKSGFDTLEECFGDLSGEIFAVETGLSSDPPMNWRVSELDGLTLLSNSDAHSPMKLAREANRFGTELCFSAIREAIRRPRPSTFLGTVEFFPEEGKYHLDGHRRCGVAHDPSADRGAAGRSCPRCGKPLTIGVLHRVEDLASRPPGFVPQGAAPYQRLVPLVELLAEISGTGAQSKGVQRLYGELLARLGPELEILMTCPLERIAATAIQLLDEAIGRMRQGDLHATPGYDGVYGAIRVFTPQERSLLLGAAKLFPFTHRPRCDPQ
jgi:uncharacterized protein (TIGR00375 family)